MLVIALRKDVAEWARQPIIHGSSVMYVIVLGPEDVPRITDLAEARANPALAVLSAAIHARFVDGHQVSRAAVEARLTVDEATRTRVTACEDADQLEQWFDRAIVASRTDEVFA